MKRKERVLCAIERGIPDRVPMDFSANQFTLQKLYEYYKVHDYMDLLKILQVDIVDIRGVVDPVCKEYPVSNERYFENGIKQNYWGMRTKIMQGAGGPEECYVDFVLKDAETIEELEKYNWPDINWFDFSGIREGLQPWSEFAIMASGGSVFQHVMFLRSLAGLLMDIAGNIEIAEYLMDKFTNFYLAYFDRLFDASAGMIDIFRIADDIGMQDRQLISTEAFHRFIIPRLRKLVELAHSYNIKVLFHSCGSIIPFMPGLIEAGVDIIDPIQTRAKDMDPARLKKDFGDRICFHGSVDTQYTLVKGSAMEVRNEVIERIRVLGKDGGFILAPSHVLQADVPVENIAELYRAGYEFGNYS